MILEWLLREGGYFISWWLLATLAGVAVLPLCWRVLSGLPDRGTLLARSVGILLVAFTFWLLASLRIVPNSTGAMLLAWLIVLSVSLAIYARMPERVDWREIWHNNRAGILVAEGLFAVLLLGWMVIRAHYPETFSTEKPMDLMYISSIMRSPAFPPSDGWMSGYAVSYYYFGYVMSAMFGKLSGANGAITLSMTLAMWFSLAGTNAFAVVYNLVRSRVITLDPLPSPRPAIGAGLLAMVFIVFLSNFQLPIIELPWQAGLGDASYYDAWGIRNRTGDSVHPEDATVLAAPDDWEGWWWFSASRVLTDYNLDGTIASTAPPIDEFPIFSFVLGDMHPHVLSLPFGIMALGLSLSLLLARRNPSTYELVFYGITVGAFVFLNTWDILAYFGALVGADALRRIMHNDAGRLTFEDILSLVGDGVVLLAVTFVSYFVFLYSFRSQAGGIAPNILYPTFFPQLYVMFAPFLLILTVFVLVEGWRGARVRRMNWRGGFSFVGILLLLSVLLLVMVGLSLALNPAIQSVTAIAVAEMGGFDTALPLLLLRRLVTLPTALAMLTLLVVIVARLFSASRPVNMGASVPAYSAATGFTLLLVAIGALLVFVPEFVYLQDVFSSRSNTIFKFYYQAWAVWGIASAYASYSLLADGQTVRASRVTVVPRLLFAGLLTCILVAGLYYAVAAIYSRSITEALSSGSISTSYGDATGAVVQAGQPVIAGMTLIDGVSPIIARNSGFAALRGSTLIVRAPMTLDGTVTMLSPDDLAMVQCLGARATPEDVIVEAVRGEYDPRYGRVASITGAPILLGWENHERQWRGNTYDEVAGTRRVDIDRLYNDLRWDVAQDVINAYQITYVVYGDTERGQYVANGESKFMENAISVCAFGNSKVYRVRPLMDR